MVLKFETRQEVYSIRNLQAQCEYVGGRTAASWLGFFLPYLHEGMSLLDCGCGVGSITLDLGRRVTPVQVVGIDIDRSQVELARRLAAEQACMNVRFVVGSVYELPFPDKSFDSVLAHTVLLHLSNPLCALREMCRVLSPGGVIAVADDDFSTMVSSPPHPLVEKVGPLWAKVIERSGGSPFYSRHLRSLLSSAGCTKTEGHAVAAEYYGNQTDTRRFAALMEHIFRDPAVIDVIRDWADQNLLDAMIAGLKVWAEAQMLSLPGSTAPQ